MRGNSKLRCLFGMIVVLLSAALTSIAQTPTTSSLEKDFFKNILEDQKAIWTAPLHIERSDTKWIVPGSVGLMALITTDRMTGDEMAEFDRQVGTSKAISRAGSIYGLGAVAGTFYLLGRKTNNARARETGLLSAEALVNSFLVSSAIKGVTQRVRPATGRERSEFFDGGYSFPSGHSTQVWAVATVIASEYHDRRSVQIAAFATASAVSIARFAEHKHYLSDVLAGSALGYGIGKYVYHKRHRDVLNSSVSNVWWPTITPEVNRRARQYGVGLTWSF
ncbi:MAG TPA: phosphatase PAP2 family protein [Pyrinomonadaceae bacterium]|nr:phosphatase PAP2 family protein [Pyrinomonadaceae bacterium]